MSKEPTQKFKYKKERIDWILIGIIIFTLVCVGLIMYGIRYFDGYNTTRDVGSRNEINELIENRQKLEQQINEYLNDPDFNPNNDNTQ